MTTKTQSSPYGVLYPLFLDGGLGNDTGGARFDVLVNILSKLRPIKMLMQYCHYLFYTEMSHFLTTMIFPDNFFMLA
jgi:hypothetical protein